MKPTVGALLLYSVIGCGCGGAPAATAAEPHCSGAPVAPSIQPHAVQPGGPGAWVEIAASHVDKDNRVLLDGHEVPIVRITGGEEHEETVDPTAGQLRPDQRRPAAATSPHPHIVAFRIPAGISAGTHAIALRTCGAISEETVPLEVLPNAAPTIESVRVIRGEWASLVIKGTGLASATEVVLVAPDGTATTLSNVTRVDDSQLKVPLEKLGAFDVFVRSPHGLGGGPPSGVTR